MQSRNVSQIQGQTLPKQKEGPPSPLTKQTTERHVEQRPETHIMPEHTIRPEITDSYLPKSSNETTSQTAGYRNAR